MGTAELEGDTDAADRPAVGSPGTVERVADTASDPAAGHAFGPLDLFGRGTHRFYANLSDA